MAKRLTTANHFKVVERRAFVCDECCERLAEIDRGASTEGHDARHFCIPCKRKRVLTERERGLACDLDVREMRACRERFDHMRVTPCFACDEEHALLAL